MRGESIGQTGAGTRAPGGPDGASDELLALLAAVDDWVFVLDADGRILRASTIAQQRLAGAAAEGAEFVSLWREDQREPLAAALSALGQGARAERILLEVQATPGVRIELRLTQGTF